MPAMNFPRARSRTRRAPLPTWLEGKPLNEWFAIANTSVAAIKPGAGAYNGMALAETNGHVYCVMACSGGHTDSHDNSVVSMDLAANVPAWSQNHASDPIYAYNLLYTPQNRPISRHTYWNTKFVSQLDRVVLFGGIFGWGNETPRTYDVEGFNLATNQWDGVVADQPGASGNGRADLIELGYPCCVDPATGDMYMLANYTSVYKWDFATKTQTLLKTFSGGKEFAAPMAFDPVRQQLVSIGFGAGVDDDDIPNFHKISLDGQTRTELTLTSADGNVTRDAFLADAEYHAALVHDPVADVFYWFGNNTGAGKLYVITPNAGSTWTIALFSFGAGSVNPPAALPGTALGVFNRLDYSAVLGGLVLVLTGTSQNTYFMKLR